MRNAVRIFVALWYLFGWMLHVYLGLFAPEAYRPFGATALIPSYPEFWNSVAMPSITGLALLLAAFEILVGCLLISKGKWVKAGLILSILFNLFLVQMGLADPNPDPLKSFLGNRLPNLIFIALQIPLFWGKYERSIPELIRGRFLNPNRAIR